MSTRRASRIGLSGIKYKVARAGNTFFPDLPQSPTIGTAVSQPAAAIVSFTPAALGGLASSFTVTSIPGGIVANGASSPITVTGLTAGQSYTFTVRANNSSGSSPESAQSNSVTPTEQVVFQVTSSGTWTAPATGTYRIHCVGGGGGGGGFYGSGGAGGFYATGTLSLVGGTAYTVTIGNGGIRTDSGGTAGSGGSTSFVGPSTITANGGGGGSSRNFGTSGVGGNGGSGGAPAANASTGHGGGGGGYDGSNSSFSTCPTQGGQNPGTGQLGVAIGLGTNTFIPAGGAGGFLNATCGGTRSGLGGIYQGIFGFGAGKGGNYAGTVAEGHTGSFASGRGCGGGGANWFANGAGDGTPGQIVIERL